MTLAGDEFIKQHKGNIKPITTSAKWFGVTYKEESGSAGGKISSEFVG